MIEFDNSEELEKILLFNAASEYIDTSWGSMEKRLRIFLQYFNAYTLAESERMLIIMHAFRKNCSSDMCIKSDMSNMLIEDFLYELHVALDGVKVSKIFQDGNALDNAWYLKFVEYTCEQINRYWIETGHSKRLTNTSVMRLLNISQSKHSEWQKQKKLGPILPPYISLSALSLGGVPLCYLASKFD
jgi:hypothetical protein